MTNIYFLPQCQHINKRKGYGNISQGSLQEKLTLIFNQIMYGDQSGEFSCGHWEGQKMERSWVSVFRWISTVV